MPVLLSKHCSRDPLTESHTNLMQPDLEFIGDQSKAETCMSPDCVSHRFNNTIAAQVFLFTTPITLDTRPI